MTLSILIASSTLSDTATVSIWYGLLIIVLAVLIDLLLGEPPNAAHPVVWIGKVIGFMDRHTRRTGSKRAERARGVLLAIVGCPPLTRSLELHGKNDCDVLFDELD